MPKPFPKEFREDVVRVARGRDPGVTLEQIATDFGIHPMTLSKWLRQADIDDGALRGRRDPRVPIFERRTGGSGCWSRRMRSCAVRPPICPRRTSREKALPARE
jgi:transposase-like protein